MPSPSRRESAAAILLGPLFGLDPWTARSWPEANNLTRKNRLAVMRATRRGKNIGDARLAPAVIGYAQALRNTKDRFLQWEFSVIEGVALFIVLNASVHAGWLCALVGGLAAAVAMFVFYALWTRRRVFSLADRAEKFARQVPELQDDMSASHSQTGLGKRHPK
ncbi:MAG: hypothetical protein JO106_08930 [Mycobacterium sp.]|nr:hypothetical protein [Mycobacterium sp.]